MGFLTIISEVSRRLITTIISQGAKVLFMAGLITWDLSLVLLNLVWPRRKKGEVVTSGLPGHKGIWPEYRSVYPETDWKLSDANPLSTGNLSRRIAVVHVRR